MKNKFYAVKVGKQTGIFDSWAECEPQIKGFPGAKHKSFPRREEAAAWMAGTTAPASNSHGGSDHKGKKRLMSPDVANESEWDVVYSDGACKGNGQFGATAGVGVWWGVGDRRNIAERCPGDQTNNRAELIAILRVLETTPTVTPEGTKPKSLLIKTDSKYSIQCFKDWLPGWVKNGFINSSKEPVKNAPLIRYISAQLDARARRGQQVRLQYVKGHSGDTGNDGADAQANLGAREPKENERDWAKLEADFRKELEVELRGQDKGESAPLEVADEDVIAVRDPRESPAKMRKTSSVTDKPSSKTAVTSSKPISRSTPQDPPPALQSAASSTSTAQIAAEDLAQYADGLLDENDLLGELSD